LVLDTTSREKLVMIEHTSAFCTYLCHSNSLCEIVVVIQQTTNVKIVTTKRTQTS